MRILAGKLERFEQGYNERIDQKITLSIPIQNCEQVFRNKFNAGFAKE